MSSPILDADIAQLHVSRSRSVATEPPTAANAAVQGAFRKQAMHSIAPFLSKHVPNQYNPLGTTEAPAKSANKTNTKYCYRHHPDLKCRRQANEPSMEQLQNELGTLPEADQEGIAHVWSLFAAAPSKHRDLMLQGILAQCCFPQLSSISAAVRDLIKIDFLTALPAELGLRILSYLDPASICKATQVSERWRVLADDDVVWHRMCEQHIDRKCTKCGIGLPLLDRKRLRTEKRQIQLRANGWNDLDSLATQPALRPHADETTPSTSPGIANTSTDVHRKRVATEDLSSPGAAGKRLRSSVEPQSGTPKASKDSYFSPHAPQRQPWKAVYRERHRIGTNWKYGRCSIRTFKGHTNGVMCLQFDDHILASGSYDSTIKIWDIETATLLRTLTGHTLGIRCLQFDNTKLASGSLDGTVKIWDLETGNQLCSLSGHTGGVIGLHFDGTLVASGSVDTTVRVWNFADKSAIVLRGHTDWVNSVRIDSASNTLFSASDDCTIRLWDLATKRCIRSFEGHAAPVQQVVPLPPEFELPEACENDRDDDDAAAPAIDPQGSDEEPFRYPSPDSDLSRPSSPFAHGTPNTARPLPPQYMLTGSLDLTIRLWDVRRGTCLRTFFGHVEGIWALAADTLRVVSGANDGMVKLWDPRSGKCQRTFAGHAGPVTCVGLSEKRMATGSEDHEIRLYSFCA